jgi:1,4-dihydroxy-2-naphthoate octaprenyltransferase
VPLGAARAAAHYAFTYLRNSDYIHSEPATPPAPSLELRGDDMAAVKVWFKELRAEFLTASVIPAILSIAVARFETGSLDLYLAAMAFAGAVFLHLGTNTANDYYDHLSGADAFNVQYVRPFTGGSRLIQEGLISPTTVLVTSISFYAAALIIGVLLAAARGPLILVFGLIGLLSGYFYTAPPFRLAHRGVGELIVGLNFGLLLMMGVYYAQTGGISPGIVAASLPVSCLIAAVVMINEFQDSAGDARAGKRTLVVRLGTRKSAALFAAVTLASYLLLAAAVAARLLPPPVLAACATLPLTVKAIATARSFHNKPKELVPANASTILAHMLTGLIMFVVFAIMG